MRGISRSPMSCPRCGCAGQFPDDRCPVCDAAASAATLATRAGPTGVGFATPSIAGLPPPGLFSATAFNPDADTSGDEVTSTSHDGVTGTELHTTVPRSTGPLHAGQAFGHRYHVIKLLGL